MTPATEKEPRYMTSGRTTQQVKEQRTTERCQKIVAATAAAVIATLAAGERVEHFTYLNRRRFRFRVRLRL